MTFQVHFYGDKQGHWFFVPRVPEGDGQGHPLIRVSPVPDPGCGDIAVVPLTNSLGRA